MDEFLLVDGYNIVNSWPELQKIAQEDLEAARSKLIDILQDYQGYVRNHIILVFDAHMIKGGLERHEFYGNLEVVYTKEDDIADTYIERWVHEMRNIKNIIRVATSDSVEQTIVLSRGAARMSARELRLDIQRVKMEQNQEYLNGIYSKRNPLENQLEGDILKKLEKWRRK